MHVVNLGLAYGTNGSALHFARTYACISSRNSKMFPYVYRPIDEGLSSICDRTDIDDIIGTLGFRCGKLGTQSLQRFFLVSIF